jgi:spermidine synthase
MRSLRLYPAVVRPTSPALPWQRRAILPTMAAAVATVLSLAAPALAQTPATDPVDQSVRDAVLKRPDGQIARVKTEFNDIVISKLRHELTMSFRVKTSSHIETIVNLRDPDDLPLHYTRSMTTALAYPNEVRRVLMVGLGGGAISTYLARAMPELHIDTVDIDPGVIGVAREYFGLRETPRVRFFANDGRFFVRRAPHRYDLAILDAFQGASVPFHLLTREFYALLKDRLTPSGVAVFNVHEGTKLYLSTLRTLSVVFPEIHLYPSGRGEMIVVAMSQAAPDAATLARRAADLQQKRRQRAAADRRVRSGRPAGHDRRRRTGAELTASGRRHDCPYSFAGTVRR